MSEFISSISADQDPNERQEKYKAFLLERMEALAVKLDRLAAEVQEIDETLASTPVQLTEDEQLVRGTN